MFNKVSKIFALGLTLVLAAGLFTGCGRVDGSKTAMTVNGEALSLGTANLYMRYSQCTTYYYMLAYGLASSESEFWDSIYDTDTNTTTGDYYKSEWQNTLVQMMVLNQHAEEYGVTISDEEMAKISEAAAEFMDANGSVAEWIGADQEAVEEMIKLIYIQNNMYDPMIADVDTEVTDEEAKQSTFAYSYLTYTPMDQYTDEDVDYDEYKAALVENCNELISQLNDDPDADKDSMSDMAEAINEDFYSSTTSYGPEVTDTSFDTAVTSAAATLEDGGVYQEVIDTGSYLYVIKMISTFDEEATEENKEDIVSERQQTAYNELLDSWVDSADVVIDSSWDALKVNDKERYTFKEV